METVFYPDKKHVCIAACDLENSCIHMWLPSSMQVNLPSCFTSLQSQQKLNETCCPELLFEIENFK